MMMSRRSAPVGGGFTLVELMVTLAILAIVVTMAAPSFNAYIARTKLRGVASEAYGDFQYARSESAQKNRVVRIEVSATGYEIWLMTAADPTVKDGLTPLKAVTDWSGSGVTLSGGSAMRVNFDPVRATATVTDGPLVLSHPAVSGTLRVSVLPTGRPELCSPGGTISGVSPC